MFKVPTNVLVSNFDFFFYLCNVCHTGFGPCYYQHILYLCKYSNFSSLSLQNIIVFVFRPCFLNWNNMISQLTIYTHLYICILLSSFLHRNLCIYFWLAGWETSSKGFIFCQCMWCPHCNSERCNSCTTFKGSYLAILTRSSCNLKVLTDFCYNLLLSYSLGDAVFFFPFLIKIFGYVIFLYKFKFSFALKFWDV